MFVTIETNKIFNKKNRNYDTKNPTMPTPIFFSVSLNMNKLKNTIYISITTII